MSIVELQDVDFDDVGELEQGRPPIFVAAKVVERKAEAPALEFAATLHHAIVHADGFEQFEHHLFAGQRLDAGRQQHLGIHVDEAAAAAEHGGDTQAFERDMDDAGGCKRVIGHSRFHGIAAAIEQLIRYHVALPVQDGLTAEEDICSSRKHVCLLDA